MCMRSLARRAGIYAVSAAIVLTTGCGLGHLVFPTFPDEPNVPAAPDIDYARMNALFTLAYDAAQVEGDTAKADNLRAQYAQANTDVYVRVLPDVAIDYLVVVDHATKQQTVALPPTHNHANVTEDLDADLVTDSELGISLDRGWRDVALAVRQDVVPLLQSEYDLTVTGYSLGGAAAVILAMYLTHDQLDVDQVVTFGQPKVTDASGAQQFADLPLLRFTAAEDPVPTLPPGLYVHLASEVMLLDGPYIAYLTPNDPDYAYATDFDLNEPDDRLLAHTSYGQRLGAKLAGEVVQVPFSQWPAYVQTGE